jgi:hypothetical protein
MMKTMQTVRTQISPFNLGKKKRVSGLDGKIVSAYDALNMAQQTNIHAHQSAISMTWQQILTALNQTQELDWMLDEVKCKHGLEPICK